MENNDNMILSDQTVSKEYQIPELVDLNSISEAMGEIYRCMPGSSAVSTCGSGSTAVFK